MSPRHRLAVALLWLTPALWSSNYLIARAADGVIAPHMLASLRWGLAGALLLPFAWRDFAAAPAGWWRAEWPHLLVLGALGMWVCGAIVYLGAQTTSALNIGLIYAACPVGIAIIGVRLLGERLSGTQRVSMALALAGVVYVIARGDPANLLNLRLTPGDGWIVLAALSWVAYSVLLSRWRSVLGGAARLVATIAGGLVLLLPLTLLEAWLQPTPGLTAQGLLLGAAAALLPGALSYSAFGFIQRELGVARSALMMYVAPLWAALLGWLMLGEPPRAYHLVGAALILPAIWLASRR
ncbi:MAG: DMT family transporter [Aquabacterium sp.]